MTIILCPECGQNVSDKADKCIHCGYPLNNEGTEEQVIRSTHLWRCSTCGNMISEEPCRFCTEKDNNQSKTTNDPIEVKQKTVEKSMSSKKVFGLIIVVIILIVLFIVWLLGDGNNNNKNNTLDPNRTTEPCAYYGETKVFGWEHQSIYNCISDGDGYYYPIFGHHHHK